MCVVRKVLRIKLSFIKAMPRLRQVARMIRGHLSTLRENKGPGLLTKALYSIETIDLL